MQLIGTDLSCERGGRTVFSGISFAVSRGELLEITGPNGAGKSTLLRLVAGLSEPAQGALKLEGGGADLTAGQQAHFVAHQDAIKPALSVSENLRFWGDFLGGGEVERALQSFSLEPMGQYPAGLLSAGQKRRLALSRLALVPRLIWLLDEPTVGLDQGSREQLFNLMRAQLRAGGLILVTTHVPLGIAPDISVRLGDAQ
jgi:heme exporter protein A